MSNTELKKQSEALLQSGVEGGGDPPDPEKAKLATRGGITALLYAAGLLILSLASCGDGEKEQKNELETLRQALNAQLSAYVLCTTTPTESNFPGTLVSNVGNGDDKFFPGPTEQEWNNDLANYPTKAKRYAWKNYTLELTNDLTGEGSNKYNVYSWSNGVKTKVGQLNSKWITAFFPEDDLFVGDGVIYQLTEQGGTVVDVKIGPVPPLGGGNKCMKDGDIMMRHQEGYNRYLSAIGVDPSNPTNPIVVKNQVLVHVGQAMSDGYAIDYENGMMVIGVGNGYKIFKNLPEGADWMDNFQNYMGKYVDLGTTVVDIKIVQGVAFLKLSETEILILQSDGTEQTVHKDDLEGGLFKDMVKTDQGVLVMCAPQPYLFKINEDGTVTPQKDPGDHTSEAEQCSPLSEEQVEAMFTEIPDPTEPDPELSPDQGPDIFIQPDQDTKDDSTTDNGSNPDADANDAGDTFDADVPYLDSADGLDAIDPDLTDPDADAKPGDIKPGDLPPDAEPDAGDVKPDPDIQPNETTPDQKPDGKTPDEGSEDTEKDASIPPEQATEQTSGEDQNPDTQVNPDDSIQSANPGCGGCATTEPLKPQGPGGKAAVALMALSAFLGLKAVGKRRRKEEEIVK